MDPPVDPDLIEDEEASREDLVSYLLGGCVEDYVFLGSEVGLCLAHGANQDPQSRSGCDHTDSLRVHLCALHLKKTGPFAH